jgi:hypothetical protein
MEYRTDELMLGFRQILDHAAKLRSEGRLEIRTMAEQTPSAMSRAA